VESLAAKHPDDARWQRVVARKNAVPAGVRAALPGQLRSGEHRLA